MNKLFSLVFCFALLALPMATGCNTEPEPVGVEEVDDTTIDTELGTEETETAPEL